MPNTLKAVMFKELKRGSILVFLELLLIPVFLADINLNQFDAYLKHGFHETDITNYPTSDKWFKNTWYTIIPIIAVTADAMSTDEEECHDAGMNDYMSKPITREVLVEKLVSTLEQITEE